VSTPLQSQNSNNDDLSNDGGADALQVQELSSGIGSACEEAAVLYANGHMAMAETLLNEAVENSAHSADEWPWAMLFDLYRLSGQRERFEARVIEYATRFEHSPPPWIDLSVESVAPRAGNRGSSLRLSGVFNSGQSRQLDQALTLGERNGALRIDFGGVRDADEEGCAMLLEVIARLRRKRVKVALSGVDKLIGVLSDRVETGVREARAQWLLLLELLQHDGAQERFDEVALDFAVTFEESPPSWLPVTPLPAEAAENEGETEGGDGHLSFEGEISDGGRTAFAQLIGLSEKHKEITVHCGRLRRIDFVSAGALFNVLSTLSGKGCQVVLCNVNALVLALFHVMGVGQVAQIAARP